MLKAMASIRYIIIKPVPSAPTEETPSSYLHVHFWLFWYTQVLRKFSVSFLLNDVTYSHGFATQLFKE